MPNDTDDTCFIAPDLGRLLARPFLGWNGEMLITLRVLNWAAQRGIPLHEALESRVSKGLRHTVEERRRREAKRPPGTPASLPPPDPSGGAGWGLRTLHVADLLKYGHPLHVALGNCFVDQLPLGLVPTIAAAEAAGRLPALLAVIEESARLEDETTISWSRSFTGLCREGGVIAAVVVAFALLVTLAACGSGDWGWWTWVCRCLVVLVPVAVVFPGLLLFLRLHAVRSWLADRLSGGPVGDGIQQRRALDFVAAVRAGLAAGRELSAAVTAASAALRYPRLSRGAERFVNELAAGQPWTTAWRQLELGPGGELPLTTTPEAAPGDALRALHWQTARRLGAEWRTLRHGLSVLCRPLVFVAEFSYHRVEHWSWLWGVVYALRLRALPRRAVHRACQHLESSLRAGQSFAPALRQTADASLDPVLQQWLRAWADALAAAAPGAWQWDGDAVHGVRLDPLLPLLARHAAGRDPIAELAALAEVHGVCVRRDVVALATAVIPILVGVGLTVGYFGLVFAQLFAGLFAA